MSRTLEYNVGNVYRSMSNNSGIQFIDFWKMKDLVNHQTF